MESSVKIAWSLLALLHIAPALSAVSPALFETLYGDVARGDIGILLTHRAMLLLCVCLVALVAMVHPPSRRLVSIIAAVSMIGFLFLYFRAGAPTGSLRKIAAADILGLIPLTWVSYQAWQ